MLIEWAIFIVYLKKSFELKVIYIKLIDFDSDWNIIIKENIYEKNNILFYKQSVELKSIQTMKIIFYIDWKKIICMFIKWIISNKL